MIIRIVIGSIVLLAITTGCARQTGKVVPLPAAETVQRIVADNSGAWIVVRRSEIADTKKLITPTYCVIRRYRPDGSIERCDNLGVGLCRELRSDSRGVLALLVSDITSPSMTASLWVFDGRYWDSKGVLPCVAVGAYRMKSGAFLV
jgi:hypothetical protein